MVMYIFFSNLIAYFIFTKKR
ncbi:hypothetical protein [Plasmodium yoelii yoelii]|uniref:Uncharacterized protein n=1 Tax=Plasmodium yoelii yoelii TaxID=73239 RepID=Q7RPN2_PLAYO|nr:hypothetical protein [Plasmodium yoelii yoelii]